MQTLMLSLTVRLGLGHRLKVVRKGVAEAFRRLARGAPWKRFLREYGLDGSIRGLDLTHGPVNAWHPHIHALLFFDAPLTELQLCEARRWLAERWAACWPASLVKSIDLTSNTAPTFAHVASSST